MLWIIGLMIALMGAAFVFLSVWMNYKGENKSWGVIFGIMGFPGFVYTLVVYVVMLQLAPSIIDLVILPLGFVAGVVNLERAYGIIPAIKKVSENPKLRSMTIIKIVLYEPFIIYIYMFSVLIFSSWNNGTPIPLDTANSVMWIPSLTGILGGAILALTEKRYEVENPSEDSNKQQFFIKTMPAHAIGIMGVLLAIYLLLPYLS